MPIKRSITVPAANSIEPLILVLATTDAITKPTEATLNILLINNLLFDLLYIVCVDKVLNSNLKSLYVNFSSPFIYLFPNRVNRFIAINF